MDIIPSKTQIRELARAQAREVLGSSDVFKNMGLEDQKSIYLSLIDDYASKQYKKHGIAESMETDSGKQMGYKGYDPGLSGDTKAFTELVDAVDFPKFVADLLKGVFDANLKVMKTQTDSYIKLMKEATKSSADFIKKIKDDDAFATLAESRGGQYNVITEKQADGSSKLALTNPEGEKQDLEDAEVKKHILEAKIRMAQEHRTALRELIVMGVTRLVVEKGEIDASVEFTIKASRASTAHHDDQNINTVNVHAEADGGILGAIFGGPSMSTDITNTNIQINTSDKKATDDMTASLKGHVNLKFKTDYFRLDNFASMYGDGGTAALKPAPGQQGIAAPAPAAH
ncbi:hypothetical protein SAMN05428988_5972 [Chitinophaga sp. YR573]|uniref:hypothetical protein n=1 Tax=Chitinophaga sp. YR573 TaxID=1881040 RepID=UPI0008CC55E5|nr:hypothetical protein [Chitinophaga sp. YR573]SEW45203.1 hypothetical protein SAMN05428988_5972 [Chitinophaga sp. YR573]